jgi:hypothetical protein
VLQRVRDGETDAESPEVFGDREDRIDDAASGNDFGDMLCLFIGRRWGRFVGAGRRDGKQKGAKVPARRKWERHHHVVSEEANGRCPRGHRPFGLQKS